MRNSRAGRLYTGFGTAEQGWPYTRWGRKSIAGPLSGKKARPCTAGFGVGAATGKKKLIAKTSSSLENKYKNGQIKRGGETSIESLSETEVKGVEMKWEEGVGGVVGWEKGGGGGRRGKVCVRGRGSKNAV